MSTLRAMKIATKTTFGTVLAVGFVAGLATAKAIDKMKEEDVIGKAEEFAEKSIEKVINKVAAEAKKTVDSGKMSLDNLAYDIALRVFDGDTDELMKYMEYVCSIREDGEVSWGTVMNQLTKELNKAAKVDKTVYNKGLTFEKLMNILVDIDLAEKEEDTFDE